VRKKQSSQNSHHFPNVYFQVTFSLPLAMLLLTLPIRELSHRRLQRQRRRQHQNFIGGTRKNQSAARAARTIE